jgi:hypothetical protein
MLKKNFKVGDRIIVIKVDHLQKDLHGESGIITEAREGSKIVSGRLDRGDAFSLFTWKLELDIVYNSLLYKALR